MKFRFNDLFDDDDSIITAKKDIRLGALKIPKDHTFDAESPELGVPLADWKTKSFDVELDGDVIVITRVI